MVDDHIMGDDFERVFLALPKPYLLLRADAPRFTIAAVNAAYLRVTGTERLAMIGRGLFDVFPDDPTDGAATGVSDLRASLDRVLRDRTPDAMGVQKYDIPVRDGSGHFTVKYWSPVNTPVMSSDGKIDLIIHRVEDVTEFILSRQRSQAELARRIETISAKADLMEAEVLRGGAQIKEANRDLKQALERLGEANEQLKDEDRVKTEQLDLAINAARLGVWTLDVATGILDTTEQCRRDYGWPLDRPFDLADLLGLMHPDDRPRRDREVAEAFATGRDLDIEYRITRPDGETAWIHVRGRAQYDANGAPFRATGVSLDVTDRKLAEARQNSLIAELNHRVKNTLAMVQSISLQTGIDVESTADFISTFDDRIQALVGVHDLLTQNAWSGAKLSDVIDRTLAPHGKGRVSFNCPPIHLAAEPAVTLHMAFHELATNALKYGALSTPEGAVDITCAVDRMTTPATIVITWRERGGPPVVAPRRRGFGSNLLESGLSRELGGQTRLTYPAEGVVCEMRLPESAKLAIA